MLGAKNNWTVAWWKWKPLTDPLRLQYVQFKFSYKSEKSRPIDGQSKKEG